MIELKRASSCKSFESYEVVQADISLIRGTTSVSSLQALSGKVDVSSWISIYKPGDRLLIRLLQFKGVTAGGSAKIFEGNSIVTIMLE